VLRDGPYRVLPLANQRVTNAGVDAVDKALTTP
jgi:hypothetical protein